MGRKDRLGYYEVLNLSRDASPEEIEIAYRVLKRAYLARRETVDIGKAREAYATLRDPARRRRYDGEDQTAAATLHSTRMGRPAVLAFLVTIFAITLLTFHGPAWKAAVTHYEPGDVLYLRDSGALLGTVLRYEDDHVFFNGATAPAYLVEMPDDDEAVWYPARDLARLCRT